MRSVQGNVSIGLPRTFLGTVYINSNPASPISRSTFSSPSVRPNQSSLSLASTLLPDTGSGMHSRRPSRNGELGDSALPSPSLSPSMATMTMPRQSVQFSSAMERLATAAYEGRRGGRRRSFVGDDRNQGMYSPEHLWNIVV